MRHWDGRDDFFRDSAARDLAAGGGIDPCFVAFRGETPLVLAYLRPFPKGQYADPLIELIALAGPLGADRLAAAFGGRGWNLDGPPPEVRPGADARQRVLAVHGADGADGTVRRFGVLWPHEVDERGGVRWGEPMRTDEPQGWIPDALAAAVAGRDQMAAAEDEIAVQAARCAELGHDVYYSPAVSELFAAV